MSPSSRAMAAFRHRDYRIFWAGGLISNSGTWLQSLTVPFVLFQITGSALWVGLAAVAQFLPMVLLSPLGGSLADRRSRRRVLLATQSGMALTALGLLITWVSGVRSPVVLLAFLVIGGVINGINLPSWQAFVSDLVPRDDLLSAVTLNSLQFNGARAIGPAIAGVVIALFGPAWAFGLNAASFVFVLVALLLVRGRVHVPSVNTDGVFRQFRAALGYARSEPGLLLTFLVSGLLGGLGNPVFAFTVVFAGAVYLVGPAALGFLNVAPGVGAVMAAPIVSRRGTSALSGTVRWAMVVYGVGITVFGASTSYVVGMVALVFVGGAFLAGISSVNTSLQLFVDERFRGRVMAVRLMVFTLSVSVGGLVQGWVADHVGPHATVVTAGLLMVGFGVVIGRLRGRYSLSRLDGPALTGASGTRAA